jgi:hypothetical protein
LKTCSCQVRTCVPRYGVGTQAHKDLLPKLGNRARIGRCRREPTKDRKFDGKTRAYSWHGEREGMKHTVPAGQHLDLGNPHTKLHCRPCCTSKAGAKAPRRQGQAPRRGVELRLGCQVPGPAGPVTKPLVLKASSVPTPVLGRGWPQAAVHLEVCCDKSARVPMVSLSSWLHSLPRKRTFPRTRHRMCRLRQASLPGFSHFLRREPSQKTSLLLRVTPAGDTGQINCPPRRRAQDPDSREDAMSDKRGVRVPGTVELPGVVPAGKIAAPMWLTG